MRIVRNNYQTRHVEMMYQGKQKMGYSLDEEHDRLHLWKGDHAKPEHETYVSWQDITICIDDMIARHVYLPIPAKTLFDPYEQNLFDIANDESKEDLTRKDFQMPKFVIDSVLREGRSDAQIKLPIADQISLERSLQEDSSMIRDQYGKGAGGFILDQRQIAYSWDKNGMDIAYGKSTKDKTFAQHLSWEQVSLTIRQLLDDGLYLGQDELDQLSSYPYQHAARMLWFMVQDLADGSPYVPTLKEMYKEGFGEGVQKITNALKDQTTYPIILQDLQVFFEDHQNDHSLMRFNRYLPGKVLSVVEDLNSPRKVYRASDDLQEDKQFFITQDQIDDVLAGEHIEHQKYRTYTYFLNHTDTKDRIRFLKEEWGIGGTSNYDHDSKGITIRSGSISHPNAVILVKWNEAEKRIAHLIKHDRYLTSHELHNYPEYELETLAGSIVTCFSELSMDHFRPYIVTDGIPARISMVRSMLKRPYMVKHIQDLLHIYRDDFDKFKEKAETLYRDLFAYDQGSFSLLNANQTSPIQEHQPADDPNVSLAFIVKQFMEDIDPYEYSDQFSDVSDEEALQLFYHDLRDIGSLTDMIRYLNLHIDENKDPVLTAIGSCLREEIATLFSSRYCDLSQVNEIAYTLHHIFNHGRAYYNTGDLVFIRYDRKPLYGTVELIDHSTVSIDPMPTDTDYDTMVEIDRKQFETLLSMEGRNAFLYDRDRLSSYIVEKLDEIIEPGSDSTLSQENYRMLERLAPMIIHGTSEYMQFSAGEGMMPFSVEIIGDGRIAMSHYYMQNGDMMADPDMEYEIDIDAHTLSARTFQQDNMGIFQRVETENDMILDPDLERELNEFTTQWLNNIAAQYHLSLLRFERGELYGEVKFDSQGNITDFDGNEESRRYLDQLQQGEISSLLPLKTNSEDIVEQNQLSYETETKDYHIQDEHLGEGFPKEKCQRNLEAISLLKKLDREARNATLDEQEVLARYVGWGGLADVFDENKKKWDTEREQLKKLLSEQEYQEAISSTLTSFYTPPVVIEAIYKKMADMGITSGNILEPSCGTGNFIGLSPSSAYSFYGIEIDHIAGKIAKYLYPNADIQIKGYEEAKLPDHCFDVAIGNVPYANYKVRDERYDHLNLYIHDYFIAKTIDKLRPGGVMFFLTSIGTMDKQDERFRKYIAERCDLLGAIRLPNDTFLRNAGTDINADILIFQKLEKTRTIDPDHYPEWIETERATGEFETKAGEKYNVTSYTNQYFLQHPEMILGDPALDYGAHEPQRVFVPKKDTSLKEQLSVAFQHIQGEISTHPFIEIDPTEEVITDPAVRNFSYCIQNGRIYYKENDAMNEIKVGRSAENRIRAMIPIRDTLRDLIDLQVNDTSDESIQRKQTELSEQYDRFTRNYGLINSPANQNAFEEDSSYHLLCSLEVLNEDGSLKRKSDIFTKRTIRSNKPITHVDTAQEALTMSMAEKGKIDLVYMESLTDETRQDLIDQLQGQIFYNPETNRYETSDEYLSGDVREKLRVAKDKAREDPRFESNVSALEKVQPEPIKAGDISVRLGSAWIPPEVYRQFIFELLQTPQWQKNSIKVYYTSATEEWYVSNKNLDSRIETNRTYGTHRMKAYKIIENTLNLRAVRVFDKEHDADGKEVRVLNKKETAIAQEKQDLIKSKFQEWIWMDVSRREELTKMYNGKFNSIRNRIYDGSHLHFYGMNPMIILRKHQRDAIARILYGGNTLLAHTVGAGKTFEMIAAGMESKRLGLCTKPMYAVPNNIINDFASDFYTLYPAANILVATNKDMSKENRRKFFARIASGDWDGIIVTHSQFSRIPVSPQRQRDLIQRQIEDISESIRQLREENGEYYTIKQMVLAKKKMKTKLEKLNASSRKDDFLYFEELGIDMLFVDEADLFKNLFLYSKMRNVSGISQTDSQRAADLHMKTQYLNEKTKNRGVVFATGTPVSNSMAELYTMQRYLQPDTLKRYGLESFDAWASTFGETVTAMELSPDAKGFRFKTRFSRFYNLPELMAIFREVADIQTADMIKLPVPTAHHKVISVEASDIQKRMVEALAERSEKVHNRQVSPKEDNMLLITNDGRKLALDQRLMNPLLPDDPNSKVNACVENIYRIWEENKDQKLTQILFCDLSTPGNDGFNVYDDIRNKLIKKGVPADEVQHVHVAKNEKQKQDLFAKVRSGEVRIINGSTSKMGAGTNVQDKLIAIHDLDCPWRPRDLEQRRGRIVRQGNQNDDVYIYRYITKGTFDSYLYQTIEKKQTFISQVFTSKTPQRTMEEVDETVLNYAEIKAIACGDERIMERCNLEVEVNRLQMLKSSFLNQRFELQDRIRKSYPYQIETLQTQINNYQHDIALRNRSSGQEFPGMKIDDQFIFDKAKAGEALMAAYVQCTGEKPVVIGEYRSFPMECHFDMLRRDYVLSLVGNERYDLSLGTDKFGAITRLNNAMDHIDKLLSESQSDLESVQQQLAKAKEEVKKPFEKEGELQTKQKRLSQLTCELQLSDTEIIDEDDVEAPEQVKKNEDRCR